ncbi:cation-translocating P-type ATPase [Fundicoccus culcitae]|uniref:HAD-IC family P-type ATPase n=1 Tax=Fundicoccus culcitae TaxID=2969821 RepID=A0ABY5P5B4_9LACT|nr:HAD-IC family P-type ATPase [Fundicoccus culcitae]UUX33618.1 HAD-IC family P-type ATPase [Fundicoccus culcitae]
MVLIYQKKLDDVIEELDTSVEAGLTQAEVDRRLEEYGLNELEQAEQKTAWEIFLENLNNIIVYLLGAAAVLSVMMGDWIEAIAVLIAVALSVFTGFFVELRAQKSVDSLQDMVTTQTKVLRDGETEEIDSNELVPGDIMELEEGDAISADGRLIEVNNLAVIESALTGESEPVEKDPEVTYEAEEAVGDRLNMIYSGTAVTRGTAKAVVTGTGMDTEVGRISEMLDREEDSQTPLDKELDKLGKFLIMAAVFAAALVVIIGLFNGQAWTEIIHIAVILAVAAIPEAMPAVSTITLSRGMNRMAEHKALVKTLSAVETLGSTSVIASDKTGTLTENQMMVSAIVLADDEKFDVSGKGYYPEGEITQGDHVFDLSYEDYGEYEEGSLEQKLLTFILDGFLANNAKLKKVDADEAGDAFEIMGDPTDGALLVLAKKINLSRGELEEDGWELQEELPFDSDRKFMAVYYNGDKQRVIVKGAPDVLFERYLHEEDREYWEAKNEELAAEGMRVLAVASLDATAVDEGLGEADLEVIVDEYAEAIKIEGLAGIIDPPRDDVKGSIKQTQAAGIKVLMITGDHPKTASVIAQAIGLNHAENTMTGKEIDALHENEAGFLEKVKETAVFARVSPENKLQIIDVLRADNQIVAMTGDGVNDAPALNGADIGVAMGIRGTEVAKESADMILTDDRFSTIVEAVREGRIIFANIKKYVSFLFSCNMVEIMTVLLSIIFLMPMPLQPLHILFLNLVIDIGPAMALAMEPAEEDVMKEKPRDPNSGLVNRNFMTRIIISGIIIGIAAFAMFLIFERSQGDLAYAQTATFTFMAVAQLFHVLNVRKFGKFGLDKSLFDNKWLVIMVLVSVGLQLLAVYLPFMNSVLGTVPLRGITWLMILAGAVVTTGIVYLVKRLSGVHSSSE